MESGTKRFYPASSGYTANEIAGSLAITLVQVLASGYNTPITAIAQYADNQHVLKGFLLKQLKDGDAQTFANTVDNAMQDLAHLPDGDDEEEPGEAEAEVYRKAGVCHVKVLTSMLVLRGEDEEAIIADIRAGKIV